MKKRLKGMGKVPVTLTRSEHQYILKNTLVEPEAFGLGIISGDKIRFYLSSEEIEYILDYLAAEANHTKSKKVEKELDRLFCLFEPFLAGSPRSDEES